MNIEITTEFLYINSDFFGLYANIPMYMIVGIPAIAYSIRLLKEYR